MVSDMTGHVVPMKCPFAPCLAQYEPIVHRLDPYDATKTAMVYPIHEVVGQGSWFGRCPASQLMVPFITPRGRQVLSDGVKQFIRQHGERINAEAERIRERPSQLVHDAIDKATRPNRQTPPSVEDYFPGRPADAPEPGVGDKPDAKLPPTQIGYKAGKAETVSTLEQHLAMLAATRRKIGEAQDAVARAIEGIEALEAATAQLGPHCDAAAALADATVGILSGPSDAVLMRATLAAAKSTATGEDGIVQATGLVRSRLMAIAGSLASASRHAETYAAQQQG
jgi:hypothetical protein